MYYINRKCRGNCITLLTLTPPSWFFGRGPPGDLMWSGLHSKYREEIDTLILTVTWKCNFYINFLKYPWQRVLTKSIYSFSSTLPSLFFCHGPPGGPGYILSIRKKLTQLTHNWQWYFWQCMLLWQKAYSFFPFRVCGQNLNLNNLFPGLNMWTGIFWLASFEFKPLPQNVV